MTIQKDRGYRFTCGDLGVLVNVEAAEFPKVVLSVNLGPNRYRTSAFAGPDLSTPLVPRLFKSILASHPELRKAADLDGDEPILTRIE